MLFFKRLRVKKEDIFSSSLNFHRLNVKNEQFFTGVQVRSGGYLPRCGAGGQFSLVYNSVEGAR